MSKPLNVVKTTQSYTAAFVGNTADPCFTKGLLESSPSIYFSGTTFFFNYSQTKNANDFKFLKQFLNGLTTGSTFAFSSGKYANIETGEVVNWDGVLTLRGITGTFNQCFYATGNTWTSGLSSGFYDRKKFTKPIQYTATVGTTASYLISKTPEQDPLNFSYMGIYGSAYNFEEYIEVESSTLNNRRIKIKNCVKLNDNSELIYIDSSESIVNEDFFFTKPFINLYMRGAMPLDIANYDETINGVVMISTPSPGIYTLLLENQNRQQYALRSSEVSNVSYNWYPNNTLKTFTSITPRLTNFYSYSYSKIYHLFVTTVTVPTISAASILESPTVSGEIFFNTVYVDGLITSEIDASSLQTNGNNFKIDLSDARNLGVVVLPFTDEACTIPLIENYSLFGTPGFQDASFIYHPGQNNTYQSFYLKLSRETDSVLYVSIS